MNAKELLELIKKYKDNPSDSLRNGIVEELYADVFDMAKEQAPKLPEKYEISDLFNAAIIELLENIGSINTENTEEMHHDIFNIIENAIQNELALTIGPPAQTFIDHEEAQKLQQEIQKNIDKGETDEKKKGQQKSE